MSAACLLLLTTTSAASTDLDATSVEPPRAAPMPEPPPPPPHLVLRAGVAPYYMRVFAVESYGAEGFIGVGGASSERFYWGPRFHYAQGRTVNGLDITRWRLDWHFEWAFDRFRLGFAPSFERFSMDTVTYIQYGRAEPDRRDRLTQFAPGIEIHGSIDVLRTRDHALFLAPSIYAVSNAWAPMLTLGYRFEIRREP
jgi:hypothetical protein